MDVHTICLMVKPRYIICWLSIYFEISSSSLFQVALVDLVGLLPLHRQQLVSKHTDCFLTLAWGRTRHRNVACKEAASGPSLSFLKNRSISEDDKTMKVFRVEMVTGREVHFEASCAFSLELWVRGVNLSVKEAASPGA